MVVRISFTINEELVERLKTYANVFTQGDEEENVSKLLCHLIEKHVPVIMPNID